MPNLPTVSLSISVCPGDEEGCGSCRKRRSAREQRKAERISLRFCLIYCAVNSGCTVTCRSTHFPSSGSSPIRFSTLHRGVRICHAGADNSSRSVRRSYSRILTAYRIPAGRSSAFFFFPGCSEQVLSLPVGDAPLADDHRRIAGGPRQEPSVECGIQPVDPHGFKRDEILHRKNVNVGIQHDILHMFSLKEIPPASRRKPSWKTITLLSSRCRRSTQ